MLQHVRTPQDLQLSKRPQVKQVNFRANTRIFPFLSASHSTPMVSPGYHREPTAEECSFTHSCRNKAYMFAATGKQMHFDTKVDKNS